MFRETEQGETQYCPMCEEWAEKYKRLQAENELLKDANAHLKTELKQRYDEPDFESFRLMGKTIDEWKRLQAENEELKAKFNNNSLCNRIQIYEADEARMRIALEEIREFINNYEKETCNECEFASTDFCTGVDCFEFETEILNRISEVLDER